MNMKHIVQYAIYLFPWVTVVYTYHNKSNTHKSNTSIASTSRDISTLMVKENTPEYILVCATELRRAYNVVNHHQSFYLLDWTQNLIQHFIQIQKLPPNNQLRGLKQQQSSKIYWHCILCKQLKKRLNKFLSMEYLQTLAIIMQKNCFLL